MPRQNGTGPLGRGAKTGRGMGPCEGGMINSPCGDRRMGWRRFWGYCPGPALSEKDELEMLMSEKEAMEEGLENINARLAELKK